MTAADLHDFTFELPGDGWDEVTLNVFMPPKPAVLPQISIVRAPHAGDDVDAIADGGLANMKVVPGLTVLGRREAEVGALPAREVRVVRSGGTRPILSQLLYFSYYGTAMCVDVTAESADAALADEIMGAIKRGARWRRR